ncbi:MAG: oxidoreductase [Nonomuraea sp.]|nr:oxidoreductase [Nonomuraea sp.]
MAGLYRPVGFGAVSDPLAVIARMPGVEDAVNEARQAVDRLYRHRVLRRASPAVSAESSLRGARASAELDGVAVSLEDLRADRVSDPVVQGALRASVEVGRLGSTWRTAPRQVLARLHTAAAAGLVPEESLGRPLSSSGRLEGVFGLLQGDTKAPALVLAAIVHAELAVLKPFGSADGVVARAAERLTLVEYGLDPKSLAAVEVGHLALPYASGLESYVEGTQAGVARWVVQCAEAVTMGVREATAICEALQRG